MKTYAASQLILLALLAPHNLQAGTAYYVDPSLETDGDGTYARPWNNMTSVNDHDFEPGDDVYFKVNTTYTLTSDSDRLRIDWSGVDESDRVIIGCYDGQDDFDCQATPYVDGNRPIFNGDFDGDNDGDFPTTYRYVVEVVDQSYITIRDLAFYYVGDHTGNGSLAIGTGRKAGTSDHINVENCYIYRPGGQGIGVYHTDIAIIRNNYITGTGWPDWSPTGGAMIEVSGLNDEDATRNVTVSRNVIHSGKLEGIGLYKKTSHITVEYNVVYDVTTYHIYIDAGKHNTIRYNLVYALDDDSRTFPNRGGGIVIDNEATRNYCYSGNNEVYGNFIGGMKYGISIGCQEALIDDPECVCNADTKIYNNTLVDNDYNLRNWNGSANDSVEVMNNLSYITTPAHNHVYSPECSAPGVTWGHNLWNTSPASGNCDSNDDPPHVDPLLSKTSGWRTLALGSLSPSDFKLTGTGSPAHDAGIDLGENPYNLDYWGTNRDSHSPWDIGAHEYNIDAVPPSRPTRLVILQ